MNIRQTCRQHGGGGAGTRNAFFRRTIGSVDAALAILCASMKRPETSMTNDGTPDSIGTKGEADSIDGQMNKAAGKERQKEGKKADDPRLEAEGKFQKEQGKAQDKLGKA